MSEFQPPTQSHNPAPAPQVQQTPHTPSAPQTPMVPPAQQWSAPPRVNPSRGLATAALVAGGLVLLLDLASAVASFPAADALSDAIDRGSPTDEVVTMYGLLGLPMMPVLLLAWVLTALWLGQARTNVANIRPGFHFRRSPAWDWLGWLVPIVSLWFPLQVVGDVSKGSSPAMKEYRFLGAWWAAWLVSLVAGQASDRVATGGGSSVELLPLIASIGAVASVAAFALWVKIVMSVVRDQEYATATG